MELQLVKWILPNGFELPMVKLNDGTRLITSKGAAGALGCSERALSRQIERHKSRVSKWYNSDKLSQYDIATFFRQLKEVMGLKRARADMKLLTDADFLYLSAHINSEQAIDLTQSYIQFIISQTREDTVSRDEYEALLQYNEQVEESYTHLKKDNVEMKENYVKVKLQLDRQEKQIQQLQNPLQKQARAAGQMLYQHRFTKNARRESN